MTTTTRTLPPEAEAIHAAVLRAIDEQMKAVGGPPTRSGMAWAVIHAIHAAGWRFTTTEENQT